jgi:hypothetical protein
MSPAATGETDLKPTGAARCDDTNPVAGDTGPDHCEGAGETVTDPARLGEEDHVPSSPPPKTIAGEEEARYVARSP